ncbi:glycogen debranching protein [Amycolatopsis sp. CM201R]|nr:glycogen debranching protein [Amycolatopsis sp. 505]MDS0145474.1 glycogen debranching protein [Amycolatopsis sp. CM201R]
MTTSTRLADRRSLITGPGAYVLGDASGQYPAAGFHIRGEMGGFWAPPIKLLDGLWFRVGDQWLGSGTTAVGYTSGDGYERFRYQTTGGLTAERVQFVPDGSATTLIALSLRSPVSRTVDLRVDAHSELLPAYPWTSTTPSSAAVDLPDTVSTDGTALTFRETGTSPGARPHDYSAVVAGSRRPVATATTGTHRGPQDPPVLCPPTGTAPPRCDDSDAGKGAGGALDYRVDVSARRTETLWFAVAGSTTNVTEATRSVQTALAGPAAAWAGKLAGRRAAVAPTQVDLPGDRALQAAVRWSKSNLADSVQQARNLQVRPVSAGTSYPPAAGTVSSARWIGAGFPDYPWLFGTDGEYSAFAAVAAGRFDLVRDHLRALRDVSDLVNQRSGKIVHEVVSTGDVYFGANGDPGNTDETAKFPSVVALLWRWTGDNRVLDDFYDLSARALKYIATNLDADHDGWPEGLGNVERPGMGAEKLDNAVYYLRGLADLADMAESRGDHATARWARARFDDLRGRFDATWWAGDDAAGYGDSLGEDNTPVFQRHWIGLTPLEAAVPGARELASRRHAQETLRRREQACYSGDLGLYHTGTGPTSAPGGNPGPSCDQVVTAVPAERAVYSLNTAIMAVAEGNHGRLGRTQQQRYTTANTRIQLDPAIWEKPGAMPEVAPSPDFAANIDRPFTDRSMVLQAWGTYGVLWPVVHQQLGVDPDLPHGRIAVVPQIPQGQNRISGSDLRLGTGSLAVRATTTGASLTTWFSWTGTAAITVGAVLPPGRTVTGVSFGGRPVPYRLLSTARGDQVEADVASGSGELQVRLR